MVASAILGCAVLSIAQLVAAATGSTAGARGVSEATLLAWQKIDQLRSLAFAFDDAGGPVTDASTDTATEPERALGGTGLAPSPGGHARPATRPATWTTSTRSADRSAAATGHRAPRATGAGGRSGSRAATPTC